MFWNRHLGRFRQIHLWTLAKGFKPGRCFRGFHRAGSAGNILFELVHNNRIVENGRTCLRVKEYYKLFVGDIEFTDANGGDVFTENAYRMWISLCQRDGEMCRRRQCLGSAELCNKHPRVNILMPDPCRRPLHRRGSFFGQQLSRSNPLIATSRNVNDSMPFLQPNKSTNIRTQTANIDFGLLTSRMWTVKVP